jgi:hypothetical protein
MSPKRIERWRCDWCSRDFEREYVAEQHERGCNANPDRVLGPIDQAGHPQPD